MRAWAAALIGVLGSALTGWALTGCGEEEASFLIEFVSDRPIPTDPPLFVFVSVEERAHPDQQGPTLAELEPVPWEGSRTSLSFSGDSEIRFGDRRVVIAEFRTGRNRNTSRVTHFGLSEPFSFREGDRNKVVPVRLGLRSPPPFGPGGAIDVPDAVGELALVREPNVRVWLRTSTAAESFVLAGDASLTEPSVFSREDVREVVRGDGLAVFEMTHALCGALSVCPDGPYFIFAQVLDRQGYTSPVDSRRVILDTTRPNLLLARFSSTDASLASGSSEASTNLEIPEQLTLRFDEELAEHSSSGAPVLSLTWDEAGDPGFRFETRSGSQYTYILDTAGSAGTQFRLLSVSATDRAGNTAVFDLEPEGAPTLRIDAQGPTLTFDPERLTTEVGLSTPTPFEIGFCVDEPPAPESLTVRLGFGPAGPAPAGDGFLVRDGRPVTDVAVSPEPLATLSGLAGPPGASCYLVTSTSTFQSVPLGQERSAEILVSVRDFGNNAAVASTRILFDHAAPRPDGASFSPPLARSDSVVTLVVPMSDEVVSSPPPSLTFETPNAPRFEHEPDPSQPRSFRFVARDLRGIPDGIYRLASITATDRQGNRGTAGFASTATLAVDSTAPVIASFRTDRAVVGRSAQLTATLVLDRTEPAIAERTQMAFRGRPPGPGDCSPTGPTQSLTCAWTVSPSEIPDEAVRTSSVVARLADAAGNLALESASVTIDFQAPSVVSARLSQATARAGDEVALNVFVSEPVRDVPVLGWSGAAPAFALDPVASSTGSFVYRFSVPAAGGDETFRLRAIELEDLYGNRATRLAGGDFGAVELLVDRTPPLARIAVRPSVVGAGPAAPDRLEIEIENVGLEPARRVEVRRDATVIPGCPSALAAGARATCTTLVTGTEVPRGADLTVPFTVRFEDAAGNGGSDIARVRFDYEPPAAVVAFSSGLVGIGAQEILTVVASEPLSRRPELDWQMGQDPGFRFVERDGETYFFALVGTSTGARDAVFTLTSVGLEDLNGNGAILPVPPPSAVRVDEIRPVISSVVLRGPGGQILEEGAPLRSGSGLEVELDVEERALPQAGGLLATLGGRNLACVRAPLGPVTRFRCSYTLDATNDAPSGAKVITLQATDEAGNDSETVSRSIVADFVAPRPLEELTTVRYVPGPLNPLAEPRAAASGTRVVVSFVANEPLSRTALPRLVGRGPGGGSLGFSRVPSSLTGDGLRFEATVTATHASGRYALEIMSLTDRAGNVAPPTVLSSPEVEVLTDMPTLTVDEPRVSYVRSPTGNARPTPLGGGFALPAGPYFALAPADPYAPTATVASSAFTLSGGRRLVRLRMWADAGRTVALGTAEPSASGFFSREDLRLVNLEVPEVFVSGIDPAGNESEAVVIENAWYVATTQAPPFGRALQELRATADAGPSILDEGRDRALPLGGLFSGADGQAQAVASEPVWRPFGVPGPSPTPTEGTAVAYDVARGRLVSTSGDETWEWDGVEWRVQTPPPGSPVPVGRFWACAAYDAKRGRVLLFGGDSLLGTLDELWEWDGGVWSQVPRAGAGPWPSPRAYASCGYDSINDRFVVYGGRFFGPPFVEIVRDDTWAWDGAEWTQIAAGTPSARFGGAMAFDPANGRFVLNGGTRVFGPAICGPTDTIGCETWELRGSSWSRIPTADAPSGRYLHPMVWDAARGRILLPGAGTLELVGGAWSFVGLPTGTPSPTLAGARATFDVRRDEVLLYGGEDFLNPAPTGATSQLWAFRNGRWRELTPGSGVAPPARRSGAVTFDEARDEVVLFGGETAELGVGFGGGTYRDDTWLWDGVGWRSPSPPGPPAPRIGASLVYYPPTQQSLLFGGLCLVCGSIDDFTYLWTGTGWTRQGGAIPGGARYQMGMAYEPVRREVVVFGGVLFPAFTTTNQVIAWTSTAWRAPPITVFGGGAPPLDREGAAFAYDDARGELILFGGNRELPSGDEQLLGDTWALRRAGARGYEWVDRTPSSCPGGCPSPRVNMSMVFDRNRQTLLMLMGDDDEPDSLDQVFEWDGATWRDITPATGSPEPRRLTAAAWDDARGNVLLFGGDRATVTRRDTWTFERAPTTAPAFTFIADLPPDIEEESVLGLRARMACGGRGQGLLGGTIDGAELLGWSTGGAITRGPGAWTSLQTNGVAPASAQPLLPTAVPVPATGGYPLEFVATSSAAARRYVLGRDGRVALQCRARGTAGNGAASVALDYAEVLIEYRATP